MVIFVKTNDTSQKAGIGKIYAELSCNYNHEDWNRIQIANDNKGTIKYYINGELIAIVEYSNLGEYDNVFDGRGFIKMKIVDKDS